MHFPSSNIIISYLLASIFASSLISCRDNPESEVPGRTESENVEYAEGFGIEEYDDFKILKVYNPWQGASNVLFQYVLAGHDREIPPSLKGNPVIRTPVRSVICLSTTHIALLDFIDETAKISAVSGSEFIYNPDVRSRIDNKELSDIGYDMNLDYERILELNPDIILAYGVGSEAGAWLDRLDKLGMRVVMIGEYLEKSPLAQAEWVKFAGHLFNKQDVATEKFREVEDEYMKLKRLAKGTENKPVVMSGLPWRNSWFVPGGKSHFATLIADAGGQYLWDNNSRTDNHQVDIEKVIESGATADFWINIGTVLSNRDIENADNRLATLTPFRLGNLYNNNARLNRHGGNDYWESGIVNPHLILKDMIHILHPHLLPGHVPVYYRKL